MKDFTYYKKVLNILGCYDEDTLKKAFRNAVKENHPDKFKNPINKKLATEKMKIINEAYEFLKKNIDRQPKQEEHNNYKKQSHKEEKSYNQTQKERESTNNQESEIVEKLELYIKNHTVITIEYKIQTGKIVNLEILPLELNEGLYGQNHIYLKALYCSQNEVKTYRLDRIIKIKNFSNENHQQKTNNNFSNNESHNNSPQKDIWNITVLLPVITGIIIILGFFKVPYSIYMLLRVLVCLTLLNTILTLRKFLPAWVILLCICGICLYNPIYLVHLSKNVWQLINMGILIFIIHLLNGYFKDE